MNTTILMYGAWFMLIVLTVGAVYITREFYRFQRERRLYNLMLTTVVEHGIPVTDNIGVLFLAVAEHNMETILDVIRTCAPDRLIVMFQGPEWQAKSLRRKLDQEQVTICPYDFSKIALGIEAPYLFIFQRTGEIVTEQPL